MDFVDKLLKETEFLELLGKLEQLEENRQFCRHGLPHLLDTARIAWIRVLEQGAEGYALGEIQELSDGANNPKEGYQESAPALEKEDIYLAALLHDLGRIAEYEEGIPHHQAVGPVAEKLLGEIGYPREKQALLVKAMEGHRKAPMGEALESLLGWADKKSRNCFFCKAQKACKWEQGKQNETIEY